MSIAEEQVRELPPGPASTGAHDLPPMRDRVAELLKGGLLPALTDFVFMVRDIAQMFVTGPDVVRAVTGEVVTHDRLGGADVHATSSGVAAFAYDDEESCLADVRYLLSLLPSNNRELPPVAETGDSADRRTDRLAELVPVEPNRSYDVRTVIGEIADRGSSSRSTRAGRPTWSARWPGWTAT